MKILKNLSLNKTNFLLKGRGEKIFDSLTWNYWHDGNDPMGIFDEPALAIYDTANILSYAPISVFVKLDSVGVWVAVNRLANGVCTPPYIYYILTNALGQLISILDSCPINMNWSEPVHLLKLFIN